MALTTYALLHEVYKGQLSPEDAAASLGIPTRNVKTQVNYSEEDVAQALDGLSAVSYPSRAALAAAKASAAAKLGISTRQVNRFLLRSGSNPRPDAIKQRERASEAATSRKKQHHSLALDVLYGRKTLIEAANLAGRHERSIRRVIDDLDTPVRFPDFDKLTGSTRCALAKNIEAGRPSEHLTTLVNAQINRISGGKPQKAVEKPLSKLLIGWLEGETNQYEPGFDHVLSLYGLKDVNLAYWEKQALADELRNLL